MLCKDAKGAQIAPGEVFWSGYQIEQGLRLIHNPRFDINESCLAVGAALLAESALCCMGNTSSASSWRSKHGTTHVCQPSDVRRTFSRIASLAHQQG